MTINYSDLLSSYRVQFEGIPDPVFYHDLLPTSLLPEPAHWSRYRFAHGLKFNPNIEQEIKKEPMWWKENKVEYFKVLDMFLGKLRSTNNTKNIGIVTIPSSSVGFDNCVTKILREVISDGKNGKYYKDISYYLIRSAEKKRSHESGSRSQSDNIKTLSFTNFETWYNLDCIVVVDDVVTTGASFSAVEKVLRIEGYNGEIVNFAFARSMNEAAHNNYDSWNEKSAKVWNDGSLKKKGSIEGIIFDFDQTLVDTSIRNIGFEKMINKVKLTSNSQSSADNINCIDFVNAYPNIYSVYDKEAFKEFHRSDIPFVILSNSWEKRLQILWQLESIQNYIYPDIYKNNYIKHAQSAQQLYMSYDEASYKVGLYQESYNDYSQDLPQNIFVAPKQQKVNHYYLFSKPSERGVVVASSWLKEKFSLKSDSRIVGVGNTPEDIIAYHCAGFESVLALWGVPNILKDYARNYWGADYTFDTMKDFVLWIAEQRNHNSLPIDAFNMLIEYLNQFSFKSKLKLKL